TANSISHTDRALCARREGCPVPEIAALNAFAERAPVARLRIRQRGLLALPTCFYQVGVPGACAPKDQPMSSLARVANESTMPTSISTLAERSRREVEVLAALAQLERDLQRLSRALLLSVPPPRYGRRVRWPR